MAGTRDMLGVDVDADGDLDIFAANGDKGSDEAVPDRNELYRNDGGLRFTAITSGPLVTTPAGQGGAETDTTATATST
ncbi:MAG: FG-GAP-like repeat-containing protein [Vicinamibacterales bacterium]